MENGLVKFKDNIYFSIEARNKLKDIMNSVVSEDGIKQIAEHFSNYNPTKSNIIKKQ